jgi:hypothetical protein
LEGKCGSTENPMEASACAESTTVVIRDTAAISVNRAIFLDAVIFFSIVRYLQYIMGL